MWGHHHGYPKSPCGLARGVRMRCRRKEATNPACSVSSRAQLARSIGIDYRKTRHRKEFTHDARKLWLSACGSSTTCPTGKFMRDPMRLVQAPRVIFQLAFLTESAGDNDHEMLADLSRSSGVAPPARETSHHAISWGQVRCAGNATLSFQPTFGTARLRKVWCADRRSPLR